MSNGKEQDIYRLVADLGFAGVMNMHLDRISSAMLMADNKARYLGVQNGVSGLKAFLAPYLSDQAIEDYDKIIKEAHERKDGWSSAKILEHRYQKYLEALELLMQCLDDMGVLFEWRKKHMPYKQGEPVNEDDEGGSIVDD